MPKKFVGIKTPQEFYDLVERLILISQLIGNPNYPNVTAFFLIGAKAEAEKAIRQLLSDKDKGELARIALRDVDYTAILAAVGTEGGEDAI